MINQKIGKIKQLLKKNNLDAILVSKVSNIIYLTGYPGFSKEEREAYLFITKNKNFIITDPRYAEAIKQIHGFELLETSHKNRLENIFKKFKHFAVGFEDYDLKVLEFKRFKKIFKSLTPINLGQIKVIKSEQELKKIEKACKIGDEAFEYILSKIKPGLSEKELALELELFIRKKGASLSFDTIVAFGKNSAIPHHLTSDQRLKTNDMILLDFGVKKDNYCSDMTRVVFLEKAFPEQKKTYETVLEANKLAIGFISDKWSMVNGQLSASSVDKVSRDYIISQGFPSIPHSLGHGVGLEIHEAPRLSPYSKEILEEGMVFSIEPGIYDAKWGGVRIEDLVAIQDNKLKILTKSRKNLIELEA